MRENACAAAPANLEFTSRPKVMCAELDALKREAAKALREVRKIRRSKDASFDEDVELNRKKYKSINAVIRHLLVGHDGKPCPAGDRPI